MDEKGFQIRFSPSPTGFAAEFYMHCARGELCFQRCADCRTWRHPPRVSCARCGSESWAWQASAGRGRVFTWTVTHQPLVPGFADDVPYPVVVIELEEGLRIVSGVCDLAPADLALDLPVVVGFASVSEGVALHYFRPL